MASSASVCVFAKPPRPGGAKTRLAPVLGEQGAAGLAWAFLQDTCALLRGIPWARWSLSSPAPFSPDELAALRPPEVWEQGPGDLGERMERALRRGLQDQPVAFVLGADCPGLPSAALHGALASLASADAVLGPAHDGGYYLIGLRRCPPGLLAGLPWSQPDTARASAVALTRAGLRVAWGLPYGDVDLPEDLAMLRADLRAGRRVAPHTAAFLRAAAAEGTAP